MVYKMEQEARREFPNTDDDETEIVHVEYEEAKPNDLELQRRRYIELNNAKEDVYPSDINSPSNSSEDGHHPFKSKKPGRKTDRQRIECGQRREWADSEILQLIQLWRENDILYNTNHPLYYVQTERKLAMDNICNELQISVKDVNDKMHSLRTYYCSQRQRLENLHAEHGDTAQLPRWKFYDQMSFLYESVTNRAVKSSLSGKSKRKKDHVKPEHPYNNYNNKTPHSYSNMNSTMNNKPHDSMPNGSPPRVYDVYPGTYEENLTLVEPTDNEQLMRSRGLPPNMDENIKRISMEESLAKRRMQDNSPYYPLQDSNENINIIKRELVPPREVLGKLNTSDDIFGHMVANSLGQIEDEQQKELLKLNIQTLIYNVRFRKGSK